jgi:hypothetical protein
MVAEGFHAPSTTADGDSYYTFVCSRARQMTPGSFPINLHPHQRKGSIKITVEADMKWLLSGE